MDLHPIVLEDLENITSEGFPWDKFKNSTFLITGANGMIASYLVYTLLYLNDKYSLNIKVLGLVRNKQKATLKFGDITLREDFELVCQDVCSPINYDGTIDYIVHAASQASSQYFMKDPVGTICANTIGTKNVLDLAVRNKSKRVLYLSTREIYGDVGDDKDFVTEDDYGKQDHIRVRSCYPESKKMSENMCVAYAHQFDLDCKIARIVHTYGPGLALADGRVIGDFVKNVLDGKDIILKSDGSTVLSLTYLSDIISGLMLVLLTDSEDMIFNISDEDSVLSVKELATKLVELNRHRSLKLIFDNPNNYSGYINCKVPLLSSERIKKLGWTPKVSVDKGFERTIKYNESD